MSSRGGLLVECKSDVNMVHEQSIRTMGIEDREMVLRFRFSGSRDSERSQTCIF